MRDAWAGCGGMTSQIEWTLFVAVEVVWSGVGAGVGVGGTSCAELTTMLVAVGRYNVAHQSITPLSHPKLLVS